MDKSEPREIAPYIGQEWPGQGGIYAGIARGRDGRPDHHLVVALAKPASELTWKKAIAWAAKLEIDGHGDFTVPDRYESAVLFGNVDELFERRYHWTSTQYSDAGAWFQLFDYGFQHYGGKDYEFLARAVRRFPINPSILSTETAEAAA